MKISKSIKLFGILSLVCLVTLSMISAAAAAADPNVCRDLPVSANPGDTITVKLDITLDGANKTLIEDNAPAGWVVSNISDDGFIVNPVNPEKVSWIDINAAPGVAQLTYDVTIPGSAAPGTYTFDGEFDLAVAAPGLQPIDCETEMDIVAAAPGADEPNVCRDLPVSANPGDTITVKLDITLDGADKTVIEDNVPAGWIVSNPSDGGFIVNPEKVSWMNLAAAPGVAQLTYDVTIPGDVALRTYTFDGEFDLTIAAPGLQTIDCETQMEVVEGDDSNGGSSGGSSGGSGATGEAYENIVMKEVKSAFVINGAKVSYRFNEKENNIDFIKFDALKNSGMITITIETLKDTSALVETNPAGKIYRNMNIWVGNAGYATPNAIANPVIGFRVERSWMDANEFDESAIKLNRYHDGAWNPLPTTKMDESKDYIYFEAKTPGFSPFAITGETTSVGSEDKTISDEEVAGADANPLTEGYEDRTTSYQGANRTKYADAGSSKERIIMLLSFATIIGFMGYIKRDDISKYLKKK